MELPKNLQQFCKDIAKVAREHGISTLEGKFHPGFDNDWSTTVHFNWKQGRHGAESGRIHMSSEQTITTKIDDGDDPSWPG